MTPSQIKQALNVRVLRANQAERTYHAARATEAAAIGGVQMARDRLDSFDASYEARIAAFFEKTATGLTPESLHSTRTFHADLAQERTSLISVIEQAEHAVVLAGQYVAQTRAAWATASQAADNIRELYTKAVSDARREQERREEMDADELSIARAFRDAG